MPFPATAPDLGVSVRPGRPPLLAVDAASAHADWARAHAGPVRAAVTEHGALLVRGLGLRDVDEVASVVRELTTDLVDEREPFAPRNRHPGGLYSATTWQQNQLMCMHHELSYTTRFPGLMIFACLIPPASGGITGVSDSAVVLEALPTELVARFERDGWMLTRSYNDEIGATLQESFGTEDRDAIEAYCRANGIVCQWQPDGGLHTRQCRGAIVRHPVSGRRCWFNQIAFLNQFTLLPEVREFLVDTYGEDGLPFNTSYGDGTPIDANVIDLLNEVYEEHTAREPWQAGDLLLVDNIRCAHSRDPYTGDREVVVAMADAVHLGEGGEPIVEGAWR